MRRRHYLNMVVRRSGLYALHRIKLSKMNLFHEATENATAQQVAKAAAETKNDGCTAPPTTFSDFSGLPRPLFYFPSTQRQQPAKINYDFFSLLPAQSEGCVMFAHPRGRVMVYDAAAKGQGSPFAMRPTSFLKPANSITLSTTSFPKHRGKDRIYVMSTEDGSLEIFNYFRTTSLTDYENGWCWKCDVPHVPWCALPDSEYTAHAAASPPFAAAAVDGSTICASTKEGTYAFDVSGGDRWMQVGGWTLPFHGAAEYVPKFRLWFGLEDPDKSSHHRLCSFDLTSCLKAEEAPAPVHAWDYLDGIPDGWCLSRRYLVNLGMGKFCIATHCFRRPPSPEEEDDGKKVKVDNDEELTVLTGVEVVRTDHKGIEMIKHKSRHYSVANMGIHCVL